MFNNCATCGEHYQLVRANATVFLVQGLPFLDFVEMICKKSHYEHMFFEDDDTRERFISTHGSLDLVKMPPEEWIIQVYEAVYDVRVPRVHQLNPRHEALISALAVSLEATPAGVLIDLFNTPPPKATHPLMWPDP